MDQNARLKKDYPWIQTPLVVGAPMRLIALAEMAVEISKAGGLGFIGAGTDVSHLPTHLQHAQTLLSQTPLPTSPTLPIGIGFINWGAPLEPSLRIISDYRPSAVWFFAPSSLASLLDWTTQTRAVSPQTKIWIQVGCVEDAVEVVRRVRPDVLVVQGTDAGGHGLKRGASLVTLLPEVADALGGLLREDQSESESQGHENHTSILLPSLIAAGGISNARTALSALILGASGLALGTRLLATPEANISAGYQREVLRATDGGRTTVRTTVYDRLRGTTGWPDDYNARGVVNRGYEDVVRGLVRDEEEGRRLYKEEEEGRGDEGWGVEGRMTTYAGSGVGLVRGVKGVGDVVREVRGGMKGVLDCVAARL